MLAKHLKKTFEAVNFRHKKTATKRFNFFDLAGAEGLEPPAIASFMKSGDRCSKIIQLTG